MAQSGIEPPRLTRRPLGRFGEVLWTFESSVAPERQRAMLSVGSFNDVVALIEKGRLDEPTLDSRPRRVPRAIRLLCMIRVGFVAYDAFLNSPVGLRARYAVSPEAGESANSALCNRLRPRLLAHPKLAELTETERTLAQRSIGSVEARVWVNDRDWSSAERPGFAMSDGSGKPQPRAKAPPQNSRHEGPH